MSRLSEIGGKRLPFLRWSFVRMVLGMQAPDDASGRSATGARRRSPSTSLANAAPGDLDDAIRAIDEFCYGESIMINVGDEKGEILDAAVRRAEPRRLLELGTYCGYSALRTVARDARRTRTSTRSSSARPTPTIARRILDHAGVGDRVTVVVGTLGDGGATIAALEAEHGFGAGLARLRLHRPRQGRLPARPGAHRRAAAGCTRARSSSPTT